MSIIHYTSCGKDLKKSHNKHCLSTKTNNVHTICALYHSYIMHVNDDLGICESVYEGKVL